MILVAGVGNIWMGDDGFGSEVAQRLVSAPPAGSVVVDFGVRALDLRYGLEGYDAAIVVDVVRRGAAPGTVFVLDPVAEPSKHREPIAGHHGLSSTEVIEWAAERAQRGERPKKLRLVGCEPSSFGDDDEGRLGLSSPARAAVTVAVELVRDLVAQLQRDDRCTSSG